MLTEQQRKSIESLPTNEMAYEIDRGNQSRLQREKFAYLKACYEQRLRQDEITSPWHSRPLGQIAIGVIVVVLGTGALWALGAYLNVNIQ